MLKNNTYRSHFKVIVGGSGGRQISQTNGFEDLGVDCIVDGRSELLMWLWKLRRQNGPNFTWPLLAFSSILPEWLMGKMGKMYRGKPLPIKTRRE